MAPKRRVTLADVAKRAGVSSTSASMILNGRPDTRLSQSAHDRVHRAVEELGYRPNVAARGLRTDKTHTIGFISDVVATTRFAGGLIQGALDAAEQASHVLLVLETGGDPAREAKAVDAALDRQVDGLIFATMRARELVVPKVPAGTPVVTLNATSQLRAGSVLPDEEAGGRAAVELLVARGHSEGIALVGHNAEVEKNLFRSTTVARRIEGIGAALAEHDVTLLDQESAWVWEPEDGYRATMALLRRHDGVKALLCLNDRLAFGAYQALADSGLSVPGDVSVVGFDNDEVAAYLRPGLSTIALPHEYMGQRAVELVLAGGESEQVLVPMPVVERHSVADLSELGGT